VNKGLLERIEAQNLRIRKGFFTKMLNRNNRPHISWEGKMNKPILCLILLAGMLMSSPFLALNVHALGGWGEPPPTPGAPVYFSVQPVAVSPLTNANASINGLEIPDSPSPLGQNFTVDIHLRNATAANIPTGLAGVQADFDFADILQYCKPIGFTDMLGKPGGVFAGLLILYGIKGGFYDANGNPVDPSNNDRATQYFVAAAIEIYYANLTIGWNNDDGIVARINFQIVGQPPKSLNQSGFYGQLQLKYTEIVDYNANDIPYSVVHGTLQIDDSFGILGDTNGDLKVNLQDLQLLDQAYGSKPGDPNWNPNADIDGNGSVDLIDLTILANHYGQHYP
jgi:hypothetical protein